MDNLSPTCFQCGAALDDTAVYCSHCGAPRSETAKNPLPTTHNTIDAPSINSLPELERYLETLALQANDSVEAALKAQLQVVRYVQTPRLTDSTFDLLLENIKHALRYAETPRESERIREQAAVMVNNYIFFMDAKLQYEKESYRREEKKLLEQKWDLLQEGCEMLAQSVAEVISMTRGATPAQRALLQEAIKKSLTKVLTPQDNQAEGWFRRILNWWKRERIVEAQQEAWEERQGEFLQTLHALTLKLNKQRAMLGTSDIIAGLIRRYANDMTRHYCGEAVDRCHSAIYYTRERTSQWTKNWLTGAGIVGGVWIVLYTIGLAISLLWRDETISFGMRVLTQLGYVAALTGVGLLAIYGYRLLRFVRLRRHLRQAEQRYRDHLEEYLTVAAAFDE